MVRYKQKCMLCRKEFALITHYRQKPICAKCQLKAFKPIEDAKFKQMFDIDPKLYEDNYFLRDIRLKYQMFENLTENQIAAFRKVVKEELAKKNADTI